MNITVYLGSAKGTSIYEEAVMQLGGWIARNDHRLVYGGSKVGLMGKLADACLAQGGYVIGVEPAFFVESAVQHPGIQELIVTQNMHERKAKMLELGDAFIAFPGGTGTLEEITEIMSHRNIGLISKPCILYSLNGYYDALRAQLEHMVREGFYPAESLRSIHFAADLDEIARILA